MIRFKIVFCETNTERIFGGCVRGGGRGVFYRGKYDGWMGWVVKYRGRTNGEVVATSDLFFQFFSFLFYLVSTLFSTSLIFFFFLIFLIIITFCINEMVIF